MANKQINELNELTTASGTDLLLVYDLNESGSEKTKKMQVDNLLTWKLYSTVSAGEIIFLDVDVGNNKLVRFLGGFKVDHGASRRLIQLRCDGDDTHSNYRSNEGSEFDIVDVTGCDFVFVDIICDVDSKTGMGRIITEYTDTITSNDIYIIHLLSGPATKFNLSIWNVTDALTETINTGSISAYRMT